MDVQLLFCGVLLNRDRRMPLTSHVRYVGVQSRLVGWLVDWLGFMAYQPVLFNAKFIFIQIISSISNNSV